MIKWKLVLEFILTVFIPLSYLINIYLALISSNTINLSIFFVYLGIIFSISGLILWILSYFSLGKSFGVLPQKQKKTKRGLYNFFKHPMYIGIYVTFLGLSLISKSFPSLLFLHLVILPIFIIRAKREEEILT